MLLKQKNFLLLWIGQAISIFGTRFSDIAVPWVVLQLTDSPFKTALVAISMQIAPLFLSLFAGIWIENRSKKHVAITAEFIRFLSLIALVFIIMFDYFQLWIVLLIFFVFGAAGLFFRISFQSMLPSIVGREKLLSAHNYMEGADAVGTLLGPALAGLIFTLFGAAWTISIDAFTYLLSALTLCFIALTYTERRKEKKRKVHLNKQWKEIKAGISILFQHHIQRYVTVQHAILNFLTNAVTLLVIINAKEELGLSVTETGLLFSAAGLGNIIGVFLMPVVSRFTWRTINIGLAAFSGTGILLLVMADGFVLSAIGMFLFDGALSMAFVVNGSARQAVTPDNYLARVSSGGLMISGSVTLLGAFFAGTVAEFLHVQVALFSCAVLLGISIIYSLRTKGLKVMLSKLTPLG
ncbi:MFS family permease [Salirhabdus euzebyi]|uniref:MFS family permease n=1 Tax=Salirhabdus euzebyi TaxID=394506 RepID=A0A841Q717_9BACI|nr:MFS transporter [Salirhabdus euzebyi]MBB6454117.1 MFS family permease [Salirhabdus euzebyi]